MLNIENIEATKKKIKELMKDLEKPGCDNLRVNELKEILEKIGSNKALFPKYQDVYDEAADSLMLAGIQADACKCDPLRQHVPIDKKTEL